MASSFESKTSIVMSPKLAIMSWSSYSAQV
jgi:hypothetical protein